MQILHLDHGGRTVAGRRKDHRFPAEVFPIVSTTLIERLVDLTSTECSRPLLIFMRIGNA